MSKATNTKLMDTSPGGENTQYESANEFTKPHAESSGQFDDAEEETEATQQAQTSKKERGEKTAENIRYGEAISELGFGGETTGNSGSANQGSGFGDVGDEGEKTQQTRREQGYGGGSGVGG